MNILILGIVLLALSFQVKRVATVLEPESSSMPQSMLGKFTFHRRWTIQNEPFTYKSLVIPTSPDKKDGYFLLFKGNEVTNETLDTVVSREMPAGTYCMKYWLFTRSHNSQLDILIHTTKRDSLLSSFRNLTLQWIQIAVPLSSPEKFEPAGCDIENRLCHPYGAWPDCTFVQLSQVKYRAIVTDVKTHDGSHITPHIFIGIDDIEIVPRSVTDGCEVLHTVPMSPVTVTTTPATTENMTTLLTSKKSPATKATTSAKQTWSGQTKTTLSTIKKMSNTKTTSFTEPPPSAETTTWKITQIATKKAPTTKSITMLKIILSTTNETENTTTSTRTKSRPLTAKKAQPTKDITTTRTTQISKKTTNTKTTTSTIKKSPTSKTTINVNTSPSTKLKPPTTETKYTSTMISATAKTQAIVGGVAGGVGALCLLFLCISCYLKYKEKMMSGHSDNSDDDIQAAFDNTMRRNSNDVDMKVFTDK